MADEKHKKYIRLISIIVFAASLTQKCYCTTSSCGDSLPVLLIGWMGLFSGGATLTWLANPFLMISWILIQKNLKWAMFFSALAGLFSMGFLMFDAVVDSEAGHVNQIIGYKAGYWLWLSSCWIMLIGTFWLQLRANNNRFQIYSSDDDSDSLNK